MEKNVIFGGQQGQGTNKSSALFSEILAEHGYYSFRYRDYGSLIEGGHTFSVVKFSDSNVSSHDKKVDILIAHDEETVEKHKERVKDDGRVFKVFEEVNKKELGRSFNIFSLGMLSKYYGLSKKTCLKVLENSLSKGWKDNKKAFEKGYSAIETVEELSTRDQDIVIMSGSHGISKGAVEAGLDVYLAYPMTPATPVLHILAGMEDEKDLITYQLENELSVVNAALGASHTGAKSMVGTSGGGYDLMQEATSMQGISEIPLVVYLSQRAGAGSGVPTYTEQGDLEVALKGGHGTFPRVVMAPGDAKECIRASNELIHLSEHYRVLSILLGDKHVAESDYSFSGSVETFEVENNIDQRIVEGDYPNYQVTESGNSPRSVPGLNVVKSTSYEHDEFGVTVEDPEKVEKMVEKRIRKSESLKEAVSQFTTYKVHGDKSSDTLLIGWGSTKGVLKDVAEKEGYKFLQLIYLKPFPAEVKEIIEDAETVKVVENNSEGLLVDYLREKTCISLDEENKVLKYNGRPFRYDELVERIGGGK